MEINFKYLIIITFWLSNICNGFIFYMFKKRYVNFKQINVLKIY